ncbi:MAG TPA: glycosyltransferase [Chthoniobacterales bacterium]|jgi:glycosyltransferase involved in cell wall biosynthesis|nr:glycosyltransferase [Chthoniobacterales bacterium]
MEKPLRILCIVNLPWDPRLGATRVWFELSEQWKKAGHKIDKFCLSDAFPEPTCSPALYVWQQVIFPYRAARYVRLHAAEFEVIDCLIGTLPFSKTSLGFGGIVVGRSIGLYLAYTDFIRTSRRRWRDQPRGKFLGRLFYSFTSWLLRRSADRALVHCDCFNVPNEDEKRALERRRPGAKIIVQPYGLNELERADFVKASQPAGARLARKEICFLGMWSVRKGSRDWPDIVRAIWNSVPSALFAFLGTIMNEEIVLRDLGLSPRDSIRCVTNYDPKELPQLIGSCTVGLFPSYIEGFGLSVLEQLAAGIPTIAYDVPGPRQIFAGAASSQFLVPDGDTEAMVARAAEILRMNENDYAALSAKCRQIADQFRWEQIAADTAGEYCKALEREHNEF